jgi:hypothetical protein
VLQKPIPWLPFWSAGKLIFYVNLEEEIASLPVIQLPSQPGKPEFGSLRGPWGDDEHIGPLLQPLREVNELSGTEARLRPLPRPYLSVLHPGHVFDILHPFPGNGQHGRDEFATLIFVRSRLFLDLVLDRG